MDGQIPLVARCLRDCQQVSVCDLSGVERFVVWAIRWRASAHEDEAFAAACLQDSFDRAGLAPAQPDFEQFIAAAREAPLYCPAAGRLGCFRLSRLEAHALHALACLQDGLIGEAWKSLAQVCAPKQASRALVPLERLATALEAIGGRIGRWRFEDGALAAPA